MKFLDLFKDSVNYDQYYGFVVRKRGYPICAYTGRLKYKICMGAPVRLWRDQGVQV